MFVFMFVTLKFYPCSRIELAANFWNFPHKKTLSPYPAQSFRFCIKCILLIRRSKIQKDSTNHWAPFMFEHVHVFQTKSDQIWPVCFKRKISYLQLWPKLYLCICTSDNHEHLRSLYHNLFKNIAQVMPMFNFNQSCICLFVYLCICIWVTSEWWWMSG